MLYRIFTEDINRKVIEQIMTSRFDDFTMYPTIGYWKGKKEKSLTIEIESHSDAKAIEEIALEIKKSNRQSKVMVQVITNSTKLV